MTPIRVEERLERELRMPMTYKEFMVADIDAHAEWVNGEVVVLPPATPLHQAILNFFEVLLTLFVNLFNLGAVRTAPLSMRAVPDGNVREPDLLFVSREHLDWLTPKLLQGPADLVVEIVSDSSVSRDRADKFYEYADAGVPEYLIIDPRPGKQRIDYYFLGDDGAFQPIVADGGGQYHSHVLPGFWLRSEWFEQEKLPDPLKMILEIAPDQLHKLIGKS